MNSQELMISVAVYAWINGDRAARKYLSYSNPRRHGKSDLIRLFNDFHANQMRNQKVAR